MGKIFNRLFIGYSYFLMLGLSPSRVSGSTCIRVVYLREKSGGEKMEEPRSMRPREEKRESNARTHCVLYHCEH